MDTNFKGAIAESAVRLDLLKRGYVTATPDNNLSVPYDLIAIKDRTMVKVQIKYISVKDDKIELELRTNRYNDRKGTKVIKKPYKRKDVDLFAIYVPDLDQCYYVDSLILESHSTRLTIQLKDIDSYQLNENLWWA